MNVHDTDSQTDYWSFPTDQLSSADTDQWSVGQEAVVVDAVLLSAAASAGADLAEYVLTADPSQTYRHWYNENYTHTLIVRQSETDTPP